jgi:hypothetical protein
VVAERNHRYAQSQLNYWSTGQYTRLFRTLPITWSWEEVPYMKASYRRRVRLVGRLAERLPLITSIVRAFRVRVLFMVKSSELEKVTLPGYAHSSASAVLATTEAAAALQSGIIGF